MKLHTDHKNQLWKPLPAPKKLFVVSGMLALFLLSVLAACFVVPDEQNSVARSDFQIQGLEVGLAYHVSLKEREQ